MTDNNEIKIEIETEKDTNEKPEFLMDESEQETDQNVSSEANEKTIETLEAEIEELKTDFKQRLEAVAETEREQYEEERERLLRTAAEAENSKRRAEADAQKQLKFANRNIIEGLIPVLDSLEAAIKSVDVKVDSEENNTELANFSEGVQLVHKQLLDVLKIHGLTPIEASGGAFDPNKHEAIFATESDDIPEGNVIEEFRQGYLLHDQVIRAAQVVVSKGKKVEENNPEFIEQQTDENDTSEQT